MIFGHDPILLQNELKKVHEWCEVNLLTINCKKSQWMKTKIIERNDDTNVLFKLGEKSLGKVNEYKYLGLTIDTKLNFATHRDNLINRVNLKINFFRKIQKFITIQSVSLIYKATILPILEYADFVFDQNIQYINEKLQVLQNQALYTVYGQHYLPFDMKDSTETIHRRCKLHRLKYRRNLHMLLFVFSLRNDVEYTDQQEIRTRQRDGIVFKVKHVNHYMARHNPLLRAAIAWNDLPVYVRNAESKESFKTQYVMTIVNPYKK